MILSILLIALRVLSYFLVIVIHLSDPLRETHFLPYFSALSTIASFLRIRDRRAGALPIDRNAFSSMIPNKRAMIS